MLFDIKGYKNEGFRKLSGDGGQLIEGILVLSEQLAVEWASLGGREVSTRKYLSRGSIEMSYASSEWLTLGLLKF